jgi:hypothetical protein
MLRLLLYGAEPAAPQWEMASSTEVGRTSVT